jgi:competence ComEA-like helix-hairpin-helix protein
MSSAERRSLLLLLGLALAGQGVRWWLTRPDEAPGEIQLLATLRPGSPTAHRDSALALARPLGPGERIDADRAGPIELARLPRIGLALAKNIVADREAHGPFASLEGLDRVPGIGPGMLAVIRDKVAFSGTPANSRPGAPSVNETAAPLPRGAAAPLNLNTATTSELDALPGIGPARARSIIEFRERHGSFSTVDDLGGVPGLGSAAVAKLRERLTAGPANSPLPTQSIEIPQDHDDRSARGRSAR